MARAIVAAKVFFSRFLGLLHGSGRRLVTKVCADRLRRGQSRRRIALRGANGRLELRDIAGAGSGPCIRGGESEHRAGHGRRCSGSRCTRIGHAKRPRDWRRNITANPHPRTVVFWGEGGLSASLVCGESPLYLPIEQNVRWKRLSALAGGHRPKRAAMSPDAPLATTVGEPGIFAVVTHDRTVGRSRSHEQGRLP